jgi:zinc transport system permease protein
MSIIELLGYNFFVHALLASAFTSIICGYMGSYIVSRRLVFISGGITHASFGGMGLGYFLGISPLAGAAVFAVVSALLIGYLSRRNQIREDSAIGMLWSLGMAIGIIFTFLTPGYAPNLMSGLFGSILAVGRDEIWLMGLLGLVIIIFFGLFFKIILAVAFDEEYALTHRLPVAAINYAMLALMALAIVLSIRVAGIILVIAMLTIPPATANILTSSFKRMIRFSVLLGFSGNVAGLLLSYYMDIPSGATIILVHILLFVLIRLTVRNK